MTQRKHSRVAAAATFLAILGSAFNASAQSQYLFCGTQIPACTGDASAPVLMLTNGGNESDCSLPGYCAGVWGSSGNGTGIYGLGPAYGVVGDSTSGDGVYGSSTGGVGVYGITAAWNHSGVTGNNTSST